MKDISKFLDNVNISIPDIESDTVGSPASQSPGISSFSINLSSDDGGSNSSQRPIGSKKAKLERKLSEVTHAKSSKKLALKEMEAENKIMLKNLNSINDINTRQFIRSEQARIIQKRTQQQQTVENNLVILERDPGCRELPERKAAQTLKQRDNLQLPRDPIIKTITEKCIHVTASPFEIASPTARRGVYKTGDAVVRNRVLEISVTNPPTLGPYTPI
ncbi:hypothetical protein F2Q70_00002365 [Brassica cretica]|uniref:Uncharacterized protein n=1 Tax=Brassica cretica TaxID=69181 RepID=A0A8S9ISD5_BRACR|nr:hypothetical protein F2Q70_00002365 [Brassica cretica]